VRYQDASGQWQQLNTSGFEARVIQHEVDHLDGILFIDRVVSVHDLIRRPPSG
ncbi:MAG TPA: peptide deformylase, partial [Mariprofundaceae bacterium]|nr:peptide deformylase [Mariprofundaceae bacterium]